MRAANDPFPAGGEKTISVEVTSVVRASDRSFQVKWTETAYDGACRQHALDRHAVDRSQTPKSADVLRRNARALRRCHRLEPGA
jgi:type IV secretion system protein VirB5